MKTMKKLMTLVLSIAMVLAMSVTAMAATVTLPSDADLEGHTYVAYQIFSGTQSENGGALGDVAWGNGINSEAFLNALKADTTVKSLFSNCTSAADVATALATKDTDSTEANTVAKIARKNIINANGKELAEGSNELASGYYLIVDTTDVSGPNKVVNAALLQVTNNITIRKKTDKPSIEKKIKNNGEPNEAYRDSNNVAIGDTVNYKLSSKVPDMTYYDQYYFIMTDTMSKGLSYSDGTLAVKVGNNVLRETTSDTDQGQTYKLEKSTDADGKTVLKIIFSNFKQYTKNDLVTVTYSATLNEYASKGSVGNPNKVDLEYSNKPDEKGTGVNKPGDNDKVTGKTPEDWTITYTTDLGIYKNDGSGKALSGVQFVMTGLKNNDQTKFNENFVQDENGTYYKLKDGAYTTQTPTDKTEKYYASITEKYILTTTVGTFTTETDEYSDTQTTGADGYAAFKTLAVGEYEIIELKTLDGYNMLEQPIRVKVECETPATVSAGNEPASWKIEYSKDGGKTWANMSEDTSGKTSFLLNVVNKQGSTLPSTGGMGTTIFYVVGTILVLAAAVLLITKKRMHADK